jgi:hypothetical protein
VRGWKRWKKERKKVSERMGEMREGEKPGVWEKE